MIHGLDTGFLIAAEMLEHAEHVAARATFARLLANRDMVAIAPQILAEFIHVATDPRRFVQPLATAAACQIAEQWWTASDVVHVFPDDAATKQFFSWLRQFALGRKRLLDTLLAATYLQRRRVGGMQQVNLSLPKGMALLGPTYRRNEGCDTLLFEGRHRNPSHP